VADFLEFGELMCLDALTREESCGGHFREEHQTPTARPSATTRTSRTSPPGSTRATARQAPLHKEPLTFEYVNLASGATSERQEP
jgi:succinate dehydrogenase / fumarate reductase flavoprotein subunit